MRQGPPSTWSEPELVAFANALYVRAHSAETSRSPGARAELQRRRRQPAYEPEAQVAAAKRLAGELRALRRRRELADGRWSPERELARALDVRTDRLRRWLAKGRVPAAYMAEFDRWAQESAEEQMRSMREQGQVETLLAAAKKPGWAPRLPGSERRRARATPDVRNEHGRVEGESYVGYAWNLRVEAWFSYEGLARWCDWALSLERRDLPRHARAHRLWIVTALTSVLLRPGVKGPKSPGGYRHFGKRSQQAMAARLQIGTPISSGRVERGGLEEAVRRFRAEFDETASLGHRIFVHGIVVRNWRVRSASEQASYRERREDELEREREERAELQAERRRSARERSRAKSKARAQERSRSRR